MRRKPMPPVTVVCRTCSANFLVRAGDNRLRPRSFCSRACRDFASSMNEFKFWELVNKGMHDVCWEWTGNRSTRGGYGNVKWRGKILFAHRVAYSLSFGINLPTERQHKYAINVLHKCDNPPCCNPSHLFLGTPKDNAVDRLTKQRQHSTAGSKNPAAKLTERDVEEIRDMVRQGLRLKTAAVVFSVSKDTVERVCGGAGWAHI